jgi:hypothetical protein
MAEMTVAHCVEKVTLRLGLSSGGSVALARVFVELPLSFAELDAHLDELVDGQALMRGAATDFSSLFLPEYSSSVGQQRGDLAALCPVCREATPVGSTVAGLEVSPPVLCDGCFLEVARSSGRARSTFGRLKRLFAASSDPVSQARFEHEIVYHALALGGRDVTHTALAARTCLGLSEMRECLQELRSRRAICLGLSSNSEAIAYEWPEGLRYSEAAYARLCRALDSVPSSWPSRRRGERAGQRPSRVPPVVRGVLGGDPPASARGRRSAGTSPDLRIVVKKRQDCPEDEQTSRRPASLRIHVRDAQASQGRGPVAPPEELSRGAPEHDRGLGLGGHEVVGHDEEDPAAGAAGDIIGTPVD